VRICDYRLKAVEVLEFVHGDLQLCLQIIGSTVKVTSYEDSVMLSMMNILVGLVNPLVFYKSRNELMETIFSNHVNKMLQLSMSTNLLETIISAINTRWFMKPRKEGFDSTQHEIIIAFLTYIQSLNMYSSESTTAFRQHLLVATNIYIKLLSPYITTCVDFSPALERSDKASCFMSDPLLIQGLALALRTLIMASFRMPRQRVQILKNNFTKALLEATRFYDVHPKVLSLIIFFNINIDSLTNLEDKTPLPNDCTPEEIKKQLESTLLSLDIKNQNDVVDFVLYAPASLPVSRDVGTYLIVTEMLNSLKPESSPLSPISPSERQKEEEEEVKPIEISSVLKLKKETEEVEISTPGPSVKQEMKQSGEKETRKKSLRLLGDLPWIPGGSSLRLPQENIELKKKYKKQKKPKREKKSKPAILSESKEDTGIYYI
jgi:hypothetical protein